MKVAGFSLWTFDEMTPEAAQIIAGSGMDILFLDSVRVVFPEVARILVESPVNFLSLGGLEKSRQKSLNSFHTFVIQSSSWTV